MKYYLKVYKALFLINLANILTYRVNFINSFLSSLVWGVFSVISILLLTSRISSYSIYGWQKGEIILLTGVYSVLIGIFHTFFSRNFEKISEIVNRGKLDLILTKPIDSQFLVTTYYINFTNLIRVLIGLLVIWQISKAYFIPFSFGHLFDFFIFIILGIIVLYNVWLLIFTVTIWFTKLTNLPDFLYSFSSVGRYPYEVYKEVLGYFFLFILPLTIFAVVPTKTLIGRATVGDKILILLMGLFLSYLSRKFWNFALKFYTSAGG